MTINTKTAPRRSLALKTFPEVLTELDRIQAALDAHTTTTTGNWSIGQNCDHCAKFIGFACDGFEGKAPAPVRFIFRTLYFKKVLGPDPMPAGFKLPKAASSLLPTDGISDAEGLENLRKEIKRVIAGKEMTHPSPIFGSITHDQWLNIQTKHCSMHLGFIDYPKTSTPDEA